MEIEIAKMHDILSPASKGRAIIMDRKETMEIMVTDGFVLVVQHIIFQSVKCQNVKNFVAKKVFLTRTFSCK